MAAQGDERSSPVPRYHLVQLSVETDKISSEDFSARTQAIRSCDDAGKLAQELEAEFTRNRFIRASQMPEQLQTILADLPAGSATPVFSYDPGLMRVIVLCARA